jgi:hypothetical protein
MKKTIIAALAALAMFQESGGIENPATEVQALERTVVAEFCCETEPPLYVRKMSDGAIRLGIERECDNLEYVSYSVEIMSGSSILFDRQVELLPETSLTLSVGSRINKHEILRELIFRNGMTINELPINLAEALDCAVNVRLGKHLAR